MAEDYHNIEIDYDDLIASCLKYVKDDFCKETAKQVCESLKQI